MLPRELIRGCQTGSRVMRLLSRKQIIFVLKTVAASPVQYITCQELLPGMILIPPELDKNTYVSQHISEILVFKLGLVPHPRLVTCLLVRGAVDAIAALVGKKHVVSLSSTA